MWQSSLYFTFILGIFFLVSSFDTKRTMYHAINFLLMCIIWHRANQRLLLGCVLLQNTFTGQKKIPLNKNWIPLGSFQCLFRSLGQEWGAGSSPALSRLPHVHSFPLLPAKAASRQESRSQGLSHDLQHQVLCKQQQNGANQKYATFRRKGQAIPAAESGETQGRMAGSPMKSLLVAHLYVITIQKNVAGKTLKRKPVRSG